MTVPPLHLQLNKGRTHVIKQNGSMRVTNLSFDNQLYHDAETLLGFVATVKIARIFRAVRDTL